MFVKILKWQEDDGSDMVSTIIECDKCSIQPGDRKDKKDVKVLTMESSPYPGEPLQWLVSGKMQVFVQNGQGGTIDKLF